MVILNKSCGILVWTFVFLVIIPTSSAMEIVCDEEGKHCRLRVPNDEIILIWEHSCMRHLSAGDIDRARNNKCVIEWQRAHKEYFSMPPDNESSVREALAAANSAMENAGTLWGCNPPDDPKNPDPCEPRKRNEKSKLILLEIGLNPQARTPVTDTFVSDSDKSITMRSKMDSVSGCSKDVMIWTISFPVVGLKEDFQEKDLTVEFSIPARPKGDRGDSLTIELSAKRSCNKNEEYATNVTIKQDDTDLLRQEYLDMGKENVPQRNEFFNNCSSRHFTFEQFNSTQKVTGSKYTFILCHIFDRLERTRKAAGNIEMPVSSGYRNPYKQSKISNVKESTHMYGKAVDIGLRDFDGNGEIDKNDWELVAGAARSEGGCVEPMVRTPTWIHMDWRSVCPIGW